MSNSKSSSVYNYDALTGGILKLVRKDLSAENASLIEKYDKTMVSLSMAKATRLLHLRTLRILSRMLGKNRRVINYNYSSEQIWYQQVKVL